MVSEKWVVNASPLIVLARAGRADLLHALADQVIVPNMVADELLVGPEGDPARQLIEMAQFQVVDTPSPPSELVAWDLGPGETAVLSWALVEEGWTAILDDATARRCARSFAIPIKGTLAVVILAKQRGLIASAAQLLQSLVHSGFRLDDRIVREALARTTGETWPPT